MKKITIVAFYQAYGFYLVVLKMILVSYLLFLELHLFILVLLI